MAAEKATAIVLRVVDFSESSCIVTLLTREFGKIGALAKGGRRPKGPFEAALDLLANCRVVFLRRSSDALHLLTEAKLERRFRPPGRSLSHLHAGFYVAELTSALTDDSDPHEELFDACDQVLQALSRPQSAAEPILRFEMLALQYAGHLPALRRCAECSGPVGQRPRVNFALLDGGVLCDSCRRGKRQVISVSPELIHLLANFAGENDTWQSQRIAKRQWGELRPVVDRYIAHMLEKRLRTSSLLHGLVESPSAPSSPPSDAPVGAPPVSTESARKMS